MSPATCSLFLLVVLSACGATRGTASAAPSAEPRRLVFTTRPAPWTEVSVVAADCGDELLVFHRKSGTETAAFSSLDGRTWRAEPMPEWFMVKAVRCPNGRPIALGRPGFVVERTPERGWRLAFEVPDRDYWRRQAELFDLAPSVSDTRVWVAYGVDGDGQPLEVHHDTRNGSWEIQFESPPRGFLGDDPRSSDCSFTTPTCEAEPGPIARAVACDDRVVVRDRIDPSPCSIPLPHRLRGSTWAAHVVVGDVWLIGADSARPSTTRVARYGAGRWADGGVEGQVFRVVEWRGRRLLLGRRRLHELGSGESPAEENR